MTAQETTTGSVIADRADLEQRLEGQRRLHAEPPIARA